MKRVLPAVAILAFLILPQAAQAQYFDQDQLAKVEKIYVEVINGVSDGCLPSPNVLKVKAELILRRSGITAADGLRGGAYQLAIVANGFALSRLPSTCTGSVAVRLNRREILGDGSIGTVVAAFGSTSLIGPKSAFQQQLRTSVDKDVSALANEILKARAQSRI